MLNLSGNEEDVEGPTEMSSPFTTLSPSEFNQVIKGVDCIPSLSTASHTTSYISPATALPTVVMDAFTALSGTVIINVILSHYFTQ